MTERKRVVIFGGSFNPIHNGHQMIAEEVLTHKIDDKLIVDELWFLPVSEHDFGKECESASHRLQMCQFVLEAIIDSYPETEDRIKVENFEVKNGGISYTANTLRSLSYKYPEIEFSFLIGSDNLEKFHLWDDREGNDFRKLLEKFKVYVYPRAGFSFEPIYENMIVLNNFPEMKVSSTQVRETIKNGDSLEGLLDDKVIAYVKENKLYQ